MSTAFHDVAILGAGAAGLAAAAGLAGSDCSVLLLDARDRIGGRIWSRSEPGLPVPIELGAEFIHGEAPATFGLMQRFEVAALDARGGHWALRRGKLRARERDFDRMREALRAGRSRLRRRDLSFAAFLEQIGSRKLPRDARALARALVEGFDAADPARVSARSIVAEWIEGDAFDAPQFRPLGGYGALLAPLASSLERASLRLQLQSVVQSLRWQRDAVEIEGLRLGQPFRVQAKRAIVTLPLGVLQLPPDTPGAVRFDPPLAEKVQALARLAPGPVLKVILRFRESFWERVNGNCYRNAAFFHAPDAPFPTIWTALPVRVPVLVAWAGGPKAARLAGSDRDQIVGLALSSVRALFGTRSKPEAGLVSTTLHDWQRDPYARGAYSYVTVNGGAARKALATPLRHTLFFAGEAADTEGEAGTVAGALLSGTRAASEVLAHSFDAPGPGKDAAARIRRLRPGGPRRS